MYLCLNCRSFSRFGFLGGGGGGGGGGEMFSSESSTVLDVNHHLLKSLPVYIYMHSSLHTSRFLHKRTSIVHKIYTCGCVCLCVCVCVCVCVCTIYVCGC